MQFGRRFAHNGTESRIRKPFIANPPGIIGIDHIYVSVSDLARSEAFYYRVMTIPGFRKNRFVIGGDVYVQYYNRHFGYVLRPAKNARPHNPYAPGLHHFCFRVTAAEELRGIAVKLREAGIEASDPRLYPEYAPDYHATFFCDPGGIRLEIPNCRDERRHRHDHWDET